MVNRIRLAWLALVLLSGMCYVRASPDEPTIALLERADQLENSGNVREAMTVYQTILQIDPRSMAALNGLGTLYINSGQYSEGLQYYQRALKLNAEDFATNLNIGIARIKMSEHGAAIRTLRKAVAQNPSHFQARELLGVAYLGNDDYASAIPQLERAAAIKVDDIGTIYLLIRCYRKSNSFRRLSLASANWSCSIPTPPGYIC